MASSPASDGGEGAGCQAGPSPALSPEQLHHDRSGPLQDFAGHGQEEVRQGLGLDPEVRQAGEAGGQKALSPVRERVTLQMSILWTTRITTEV